jgi:DNA-binding beta-propeller fold protein YncE
LAEFVSKHSIKESGWRLTRTVSSPEALAARYNPHDGLVYFLRRKSATFSADGLYRVEADNSITKIATADRPATIVADSATGDIFLSEDYSGRIYRIPVGSKSRMLWVSGFHAEDDDPVGMAIAPRNYRGPVIAPGDALVIDRGYKGPKEIWKFSLKSSEGESVVHRDNRTLVDPVDITIGTDGIYLVDCGAQRHCIYRIIEDGRLKPVSTSQTISSPTGITMDPLTGDLLVLDVGVVKRLVRINPVTGDVSEVLSGMLGFGKWSGVDVSPDGRHLFITDTEAGVIFTFNRKTRVDAPVDAPIPAGIESVKERD